MAVVRWRSRALRDLDDLDRWREQAHGLEPIGPAIVVLVEYYFSELDLVHVIPGARVTMMGAPSAIRMLLVRVKHSEPYKVFFRIDEGNTADILRIRHPRQRPLDEH